MFWKKGSSDKWVPYLPNEPLLCVFKYFSKGITQPERRDRRLPEAPDSKVFLVPDAARALLHESRVFPILSDVPDRLKCPRNFPKSIFPVQMPHRFHFRSGKPRESDARRQYDTRQTEPVPLQKSSGRRQENDF